MAAGVRLGIDFGTSHTVALLAWPDGRVRPLLFDGSPLLPSAVYAESDGRLLTGRDAVHAARVDPTRFDGNPKRRIDEGTVLLGEREFPVATLIAAVLAAVAEEATRVAGSPVEVTMTHPAAWGVARRLALIEGAKLAGLPQPVLVPEPVAAAHYFAQVLGKGLAGDQGLLVYDFGGGTFDASVVVAAGQGFDVRAVDGIDDLGGLDLDALVVDYVRENVRDDALWQRLDSPQTAEDRRHRRTLWDDARIAKEMLSRAASATLHVPIVGTDVPVPRDAFEQRARPLLDQTVRTTNAVLRWSTMDKTKLAGIFLVGGSSRIPLVATLLHRELGIPPTVIEQPEMVVAEGSLRSAPSRHRPVPATPARPVSATPASPAPVVAAPMPASAPPVSPAAPMNHPVSPATPVNYPVSPAAAPASPPPTRVGPVWPTTPYPQSPRPMQPPPVQLSPPVPPQQPVPRRRPAVAILAALLVVAVLGLAFLIVRPLLASNHAKGGGGGGPSASESGQGGTTPAKYQRPDRPGWVPASWVGLDKLSPDKLWFDRAEEEGGRCSARVDSLSVSRNTNGLTGCTLKDPLNQRTFTDVAIEAQVTVNTGCAGLWTRTGATGYMLAVCSGTAELHRLGNDPPGPANTIGQWDLTGAQPHVVGLLAVGSTLTVYVDGQRLPSVTDDTIHRGKENAGAITGNGQTADVIIKDFWVYAPPQAANPGQTNASPSPSASKKPSTSPSPSAPPTP